MVVSGITITTSEPLSSTPEITDSNSVTLPLKVTEPYTVRPTSSFAVAGTVLSIPLLGVINLNLPSDCPWRE